MSDECVRLRELFDSYLSDELLVETNHSLARHLGGCGACAAELERRRRLRLELRLALDEIGASDALERRILAAIAAEPPAASRASAARPYLLVAAALGVAALLAWPRREPPASAPRAAAPVVDARPVDTALYDDTARLHLECAIRRRLQTPPLESAPQRLRAYAAIWPASQPELAEWSFVDAHVCPPRGVPDFDRQYGHVVLARGEHRASVLATLDRSGRLPPGDGFFEWEGVRFVEAARGGFRLAALDAGAQASFVVSDLPAAQHRALGARVLTRLRLALHSGS